MKIEEAIGANLARLRDDAGLSQAALGQALGGYLGKTWTRQAVWAAEKGNRAFTAAELVSLALVLKVSLDALMMPVMDLTDLLPGEAEISGEDYERAIVGRASEGTPNARSLDRAKGALIAGLREQLDLEKSLQDSLVRQALLLDHAAVALGVSDKLLAPDLLEHIDDDPGETE